MSSSVSLSRIVPLLGCNATPPRAGHGRRGVGGFCDGRGAPSNPLIISAIGRPNANTCTARLVNIRINDFGGLNVEAGGHDRDEQVNPETERGGGQPLVEGSLAERTARDRLEDDQGRGAQKILDGQHKHHLDCRRGNPGRDRYPQARHALHTLTRHDVGAPQEAR
jgi:hypothetical protein